MPLQWKSSKTIYKTKTGWKDNTESVFLTSTCILNFSFLCYISSYRTFSYCLNTLAKMLVSLITHIATGSRTYSHVRHNTKCNCFSDYLSDEFDASLQMIILECI